MPDLNRQRGDTAADLAARLGAADASAMTAPGATRDLVPEIAWRLPGCSDLEMRRALMASARLLCERGCAWTETETLAFPGPFGYTANLAPPHGAVVVALLRLSPDPWRGRAALFGAGTPAAFLGLPFQAPPPPLPQAGTVAATVALSPAPGFDALPEEFAARWGDAVCSGAVATLCAMQGRPWSDPATAAQEGQRFNAAVVRARVDSATDGGVRPLECFSKRPFLI